MSFSVTPIDTQTLKLTTFFVTMTTTLSNYRVLYVLLLLCSVFEPYQNSHSFLFGPIIITFVILLTCHILILVTLSINHCHHPPQTLSRTSPTLPIMCSATISMCYAFTHYSTWPAKLRTSLFDLFYRSSSKNVFR